MIHRAAKPTEGHSLSSTYTYQIATGINESWDQFVKASPQGHHLQTSLWGKLKATGGWRFRQITLRDEKERIVGGGQVLIRPLFAKLSIGYISKGPSFAYTNQALFNTFMAGLRAVMWQEKMVAIIIQPYDNDQTTTALLKEANFTKSPVTINVDATVKVDLNPPIDDIMAGFKSKTRYNIRLGGRKGITVRQGNREDLPAFHELLTLTGERQGFNPYPLSYFYEMWELFAPNHLQLFMTSFEDELVSANLSITFGNTVLYKKGAWSGKYGNNRPNEVMHWHAIQWAKENGYRFYDFEGIALDAAQAILSEEPLPKDYLDSTTRFKLGFGQAVIVEPALIYSGSRVIRWGIRELLPKLEKHLSIKKLANRIRTG